MLHIIDGYWAQPNNYGYTVIRDAGRLNKNNDPVRITLGYVGSLEEVLELVKKDMLHNHIKDESMELNEALRLIREQTNRILKAMVGIEV